MGNLYQEINMEKFKDNNEHFPNRKELSKKLALTVLDRHPEIFHSIQGEGRNSGEVATFIRTAGCNLHCGFCDSAYSWNYEGTPYEHQNNTKYNVRENVVKVEIGTIIDGIDKEDRVVITGGEPLLQQSTILELTQGLKNENPERAIEMETNGTLIPSQELVDTVDQFNVSPKLSNSGIDFNKRLDGRALEFYAQLDKADFKFVVDTETDLQEVDAIVKGFDIPIKRVYLMPLGTEKEQILESTKKLAEVCQEKGYNLSTRLHTLLWGNIQGK